VQVQPAQVDWSFTERQPPAIPGEVIVDGRKLTPAGLYPRLLAFCIDFAILFSLFLLLSKILNVPEMDKAQVLAADFTVLLEALTGEVIDPKASIIAGEAQRRKQFTGWANVIMCCAYFTLFHGLVGASPGKALLGLTVRRRNGARLSVPWALLRYVGYLAMARLYYSAWLIPLDKERRTLYDMVLGTNVFRTSRRG
jgi:uncharacterized RDD family membrane protein YckC